MSYDMSLVAARTGAAGRLLPITKSELRTMRFKKYLGFRNDALRQKGSVRKEMKRSYMEGKF